MKDIIESQKQHIENALSLLGQLQSEAEKLEQRRKDAEAWKNYWEREYWALAADVLGRPVDRINDKPGLQAVKHRQAYESYHDALVTWLETNGWSYIAGVLKGEFAMPKHMPPPPKPE